MPLPPYDEKLEFLSFSEVGVRYLLPNLLDIASQRAFIARLEDALQEFDRLEPPPDIQAYREQIEALEGAEKAPANKAAYQRACRQVAEWEAGRLLRREALELEVGAAYQHLARLEEPPTDEGAEHEEEVYVLRRFTWKERQQVEDEFTNLDLEESKREVAKVARNMALLKLVLQGRRENGKVVGINPEEDLDAMTAGVLISRMWSKNTLTPDLIGFFRSGGRPDRERAAAP